MFRPHGLLECDAVDNAELLLIKAELTNDPQNLGLTTAPEDDEANANLLNEIREDIQVYRASVASDEIVVSPSEWAALSPAQQSWWNNQTLDGTVKPAVIVSGFYELFGSNTAARASFDAVSTEPASRARQLLDRYVTLTPSDIANARTAT
jgi:hypothetical protein